MQGEALEVIWILAGGACAALAVMKSILTARHNEVAATGEKATVLRVIKAHRWRITVLPMAAVSLTLIAESGELVRQFASMPTLFNGCMFLILLSLTVYTLVYLLRVGA